jgi:uncharacterized protein
MKPVGTLSLEERRLLVEHRMARAREAREDAHIAFVNTRYTNTVNRCYYALFYMVSALALADGFTSSKHKQMIGWFNRTYIATNRLEVRFKDILAYAFDSRDEGNYQDWKTFTTSEVEQLCADTDEFIMALETTIAAQLTQSPSGIAKK